MSTNYNNYTFSIFKMNICILTITSTNKREKNSNFHSNTSRAYLYMEKKLKSLKLYLSHTATQLQQSCRTEKIFLTDLHRWLSLSLALSVSVEALRTWAVGLCILLFFLLSVLSRHCPDFALFFFLFLIFSDFSSLLVCFSSLYLK